jgi:hypothetical protein
VGPRLRTASEQALSHEAWKLRSPRHFKAERPGQLHVADFTNVPLDGDGFGYTAFVIDAFAGLIPGWECSLSKETAFVEGRSVRPLLQGVYLDLCRSRACRLPFDPPGVDGQLAALADERIDQLVDLAEVLGDLPQVAERCPEPSGERVEDPGCGLA